MSFRLPNTMNARLYYSILFATLLFGLWPKGFEFKNSINWLENGSGINLRKYGIAYTDPFLELSTAEKFTIDIVLKPETQAENGFSHLLTFYDGDDDTQLVIGQYLHSIIIMKGDDYENKRHLTRLVVDAQNWLPGENNLVITFDGRHAQAVINGKVVGKREGLGLDADISERRARIILGNSADAKHPWEGKIYRLSLYKGGMNTSDSKKVVAIYPFDEKTGNVAEDRSGNRNDMHIPKWLIPLKLRFLQAKLDEFSWKLAGDLAINFFGFIPFGLVVALRFWGKREGRVGFLILKVAVCGFLFSLMIESAQVWMPSRSSDLFDLVMNTAGAAVGGVIFKKIEVEKFGKFNPK